IEAAFAAPNALSGKEALAAIILFGIQLYADFAGYSAIAVGISHLFVMPATENFRQPYLSQSVIEFWTRWHISLSSWFRDYLFFPLSRFLLKRWGSRHSALIQVLSYMVTMTATGLWHGFAPTFLVWGALHGIYMSSENLVARYMGPPISKNVWQIRLNVLL